jgi:quercetin dioxygenase-like cupin family protein
MPTRDGVTVYHWLRFKYAEEGVHVKNYFLVAVLLGVVGMLGAQNASAPVPMPVEQEPTHHVVLKNDSIMVMHVVIPPGERSQFHAHSHDRVAIELTSGSITHQNLNEPESAVTPTQPGDLSNRTQGTEPLIHRVHNAGTEPFEIVDVELLQRPQHASSSAAVAGVAAENPSARIYKWVLGPGASVAMHTHERPYLMVAATAMKLKETGPDGKSVSKDLKAGDFYWVESKVSHSLTNEGSDKGAADGQLFEIELK